MAGQVIYEDANFLIDQRYKVLEILGKGSYGTVCSAIDTKTTQQLQPLKPKDKQKDKDKEEPKIAIKRVTKIFKREVLMKRAIREIKLMKHFNGHKNIISLIDLDLVHSEPFEGLYCYQELCDFDLARVIYSSIQFSEFHIQSIIYQILCGIKYIHSADVIHRDLKPGNILVTLQGNVKICDFGLARGINNSGIHKPIVDKVSPITNYVATRWYRAPELILGTKTYDKSVDLWAIGCILAELYGRKPVFIGKDQIHQLTEILHILGSPPKSLLLANHWNLSVLNKPYIPVLFSRLYPFASNLALDLLDNLLVWDHQLRLDVISALDHPFLAAIRNYQDEVSCDNIFNYSFEYENQTLNQLIRYLQAEVNTFKMERT